MEILPDSPSVAEKTVKDSSERARKDRAFLIRLAHACTAAGIAFVLVLSFRLHPDPRGLGTHEQLFLRPCSFYSQTGLPCPTCGMTTAFAHMAHGNVREAFVAQPMGALGFVGCVILLPFMAFAAVSGANLFQMILELPWKPLSWVLGAMFASAWIFKLVLFLMK